MPRPKDWKPEKEGDKWAGRKPGSYQWYEIQDAVDYYKEFEKPKIIIPAIVQNASYTFDTAGFYSNDKTSIISTDDLFLLGILNSRAADFFVHSICSTKQGGYFEYKPMYVQQIPIKTDNTDTGKADQIKSRTGQMLTLQKQHAAAKTAYEKTAIERQIEATDRQIDTLVYELYGLTEEEINIVESNQ
jgi:hypothetical protein